MVRWSLALSCVPLLLAGCVSDWRSTTLDPGDTGALPAWHFLDADGDGWGNPEDSGEFVSVSETRPVHNNRDCDETTKSVTGRVGSLCPGEMVLDATTDLAIGYAGLAEEKEFVVIYGADQLTWPDNAEIMCGPIGWGGHLATIRDELQLDALLALVEEQEVWAGYVGFRPGQDAWGRWTGPDQWEADEGMNVPESAFCSTRDHYGDELLYLALIRNRPGSDDWCLGTPDEALPDAPSDALPSYDWLSGHFICERPVPVAADYAVLGTP